jgi:5-methyltetrahydrofolate--homocysteine methyltransferase
LNIQDFLNNKKIIILDGAMGTELERRGSFDKCVSNLTHPEIVEAIHRDYRVAGSRCAISNTFSMSRIYIETHNIKVDVEEVNRAGVKLARNAVSDDGCVLGDFGSTGQMLEPYGTYKEEDFYETFKEQASILSSIGVDGFIIETMFDLNEALSALRACRDVSEIPVIVSMAFQTNKNGGRTMMGNSAEECAVRLAEAGADALGANCGDIGPLEMAEVVSILRESTSLPVIAQPNAGKPEVKEGKVFYIEPELYAKQTLECYKSGATFIGGCCGTTPEHIRILSELIEKEGGV